ncbi:cupin domain-containing protein [Terriglobus sp. TAA 43]|uniref:cupin domain-containing protein n=1 Tax=Terriglobus sp. TAA 43 TaxID=278961 RepID=UPI0012ED4EBD|nr:hypothetical protein [Terriglobus sp. TAA 43]
MIRKTFGTLLMRAVGVGVLLVCIATSVSAQQPPQNLMSCKPVAERTNETGCWILARQSVGVVEGPVYWTLDAFPTKELADRAKGPNGTVVEALGKFWLLTLGDKAQTAASASRVTQMGPLTTEKGRSYTAQYMEAVLQPGMVSETHTHPGIEAFYTATGETCLETPDGMQTGKKGVDVVIPEGVPMELTAVGSETRRSLVLILHDASKPPTTLEHSWHSKHLCQSAK